MIKKVSGVFIIMVISMISSFFVTIFLGRDLQAIEFGEFSLLKQIVLVGSTIAILGLDHSYRKLFSKKRQRISIFTVFLIFIISTVICISIYYVYDFSLLKVLLIFIIISFCSISLFLSAKYRTLGNFMKAQILQSGWKILLLISVLIFVLFRIKISLVSVYLFFAISTVLPASFIIYDIIAERKMKDEVKLDYKQYVSFGLMFWLINSTGLLFASIDKFTITKVFNTEILGIYTALSFIFTISFTIIGSAFGYVIFPTILNGQKINWKRLVSLMLFIAMLIFLLFISKGKDLVSLLFDKKYDENNDYFFVIIFSFLGLMQFVHVILHFIISAKGSKKVLQHYLICTIVLLIFFYCFVYISSKSFEYDLQMFSINVLCIWFIKLFVMLILLRRIQKSENKQLNNIYAID